MKKIISLLLICSLLVLTLSSCGTKKEVLRVFNWGDFIADGVLDEFEDLYNCKIIYEVYDSNETMMTKVESGGNYDVVFPSDYAVAMMADKDLLMEIDFSKITNYKDVDPAYWMHLIRITAFLICGAHWVFCTTKKWLQIPSTAGAFYLMMHPCKNIITKYIC